MPNIELKKKINGVKYGILTYKKTTSVILLLKSSYW